MGDSDWRSYYERDTFVKDVWGVGKQLSKLYIKNGIDNAYKLKNISNTWVKKSTNVLGAKTVMELRGIPCINLETEESKRKSCCYYRFRFWRQRICIKAC